LPETKVKADSMTDLSVVDRQLMIRPVRSEWFELHELLSKVTDENLYVETSTGEPIRQEVW
jgi:antitoxin component of MazEF toxin-antitoxin module